jgi:NAD(P)-dependent dehydrogenase (short-subunit alcohol dehydrogenase family)
MGDETKGGKSLDGLVAVVTGAAGGIGQATAIRLAEEGAIVALLDRTAIGSLDTSSTIEELGCKSHSYGVDVADAVSVGQVFDQIAIDLGHVSLLVTSAAVLTPNVPADQAKMSDLDFAFSVNVRGTFNCAQSAAEHMKVLGHGAIVTMASQAALLSLPSQSVYTTTKGAIIGLTRSLAIDWAQYDIRVNSIAPTFTATPMTKMMLEDPKVSEKILARIPLGRVAQPRDIAHAIRFLLSNEASMITGHVLPVDGGWTSGESNFAL